MTHNPVRFSEQAADPGPWASVSGLLPVHKPHGMVSKDVSRWLEKRWGRRAGIKLGHVGTLDPLASGVLPILIGKATRFQDLLLDSLKAYEFDVALGYETSTLDLEGEIIREMPVPDVTEEVIRQACAALTGAIEQVPPIYSAVKLGGKALHEYAREGKTVETAALKRTIIVESWDLVSRDSAGRSLSFVVTCSKGTYVRVLAKDLAQMLGTCGTVTRLVRTRSAGVTLEESFGLDQIESCWSDPASLVTPLERCRFGVPRWRVPSETGWAERLSNGQIVVMDEDVWRAGLIESGEGPGADGMCLLLDKEDKIFGIGRSQLRPQGGVELKLKRGM